MKLHDVLAMTPIIPVVAIDRIDQAVPLARALVAGGLPVIEVTLRTDAALACIRAISEEVEGAVVGVGTVLSPADIDAAADAGAVFAVSPGLTKNLRSVQSSIPLLPGVATATEVMIALDAGFQHVKLFPAVSSGGVDFLKSIFGPLPQLRFCPTGGINQETARDFLRLPNVVCVGGSWLTPPDLVADDNWVAVQAIAKESLRVALARDAD